MKWVLTGRNRQVTWGEGGIPFQMKGKEVIRVFVEHICVLESRKSGRMGKFHFNDSESTKRLANAGKCWIQHGTGQYNCLPQPLQFVAIKQLRSCS